MRDPFQMGTEAYRHGPVYPGYITMAPKRHIPSLPVEKPDLCRQRSNGKLAGKFLDCRPDEVFTGIPMAEFIRIPDKPM